jgi:hypothetical protein
VFSRTAVLLLWVDIVVTILFALWAGSQLVEGHNWGDDFGAYLQAAENLSNGKPYTYLFDWFGPPLGFPILLVLWTKAFGHSFVALKSLNIAAWIAAAWIARMMAAKTLGRVLASCMLIAHFLLPTYYVQQQSVLSDLPFIALFDLLLLLCFIFFRNLRDGRGIGVPLCVSIAITLFGALLVRPAGLSLVVAIVLVAVLEAILSRRSRPVVLRALALAGGVVLTFVIYFAMFGASIVRPASANVTYAICELAGKECSLFHGLPQMVARRAFEELLNLSVLITWLPTDVPIGLLLVAGVVVGGIAYFVLTRDFVAPSFVATYVGLLLIIPWQQGFRFLLPLVSILLLFFLSPLKLFAQYLTRSNALARGLAAAGFAATLLFLIVIGTAMANGLRKVGLYNDDETSDPRTKSLIAWVVRNTTVDDRICAFNKPRAMMYFAGRRTCGIFNDLPTEIIAHLSSQQASYVVLILRPPYGYKQMDERLRINDAVTEVFRNEDYVVYKVIDPR